MGANRIRMGVITNDYGVGEKIKPFITTGKGRIILCFPAKLPCADDK